MNGLRAIMVAVDYKDLLEVTLPYNRHHFEEVWIVTTKAQVPGLMDLAIEHNSFLVGTDDFYLDGAVFNKWRALETGLNMMGREGWICLMDADVLWPKEVPMWSVDPLCRLTTGIPSSDGHCYLQPGNLYSPLRRMYEDLRKEYFHPHPDVYNFRADVDPDTPAGVLLPYPPESLWGEFPIHPNINEWAGYTQIFHADDPCLGPPPWHETDWKHAGGADSFFQARWRRENKIRPPFEVLHLGSAGKNWFGRATPYLDGSVDPQAEARLKEVSDLWARRRRRAGPQNFQGERIGGEY